MAAVNTIIGYNSAVLNIEIRFFTELCVMTPDISCTSLIQIGLQIQDGGRNGGRERVWLYPNRLYFISSGIAYCIALYARFYGVLSSFLFECSDT